MIRLVVLNSQQHSKKRKNISHLLSNTVSHEDFAALVWFHSITDPWCDGITCVAHDGSAVAIEYLNLNILDVQPISILLLPWAVVCLLVDSYFCWLLARLCSLLARSLLLVLLTLLYRMVLATCELARRACDFELVACVQAVFWLMILALVPYVW